MSYKLFLRSSIHEKHVAQGTLGDPQLWNNAIALHTTVVEFDTREEADLAADQIQRCNVTSTGPYSTPYGRITEAIKLY